MLGVKHRIGGYRVIAPIGAGGFATVYRALDEETGKEVAIKVLAENHSLLSDTRRRFEEEMGLLMTVKSPSIARIYTVGTTESNQPYMVLELADRGDLRRRLEEIRSSHGVLDKDELGILARHLHDGLRHLHGMEIVHRDVSPGNILIRSEQGRGRRSETKALLEPGERLLLTDLGHAKDMILASGFTAGGGTRGFASPEQRDDITVVDHRADIFAATAILEWAAHDGLFAEALDPFFDIGLAAEPDDRFDSMEEWFTFFSETISNTNQDGSQRSKVGKVFRRLAPGRSEETDETDDLGLSLDDKPPSVDPAAEVETAFDAVPIETMLGTEPAEKTEGQPKVVLPPGSPGDQSIARNRDPAEPVKKLRDRPKGLDEVSTPGRGTSPLTRIDPEQLVDQMLATDKRPAAPRRRGRWIAVAVVALVAAGVAGFGATQGYWELPFELETATVGDQDPESTLAAVVTEDQSPVQGGADGEDAVDDTSAQEQSTDQQENEQEQPEELRVETAVGEALSPIDEAFGVTISTPEAGEIISGPLVVDGTARAPDGVEQVEVSIRQIDTDLFWDGDQQRFVTEEVTVMVTQDQPEAELRWSVTIPADQLPSGNYEIRSWVESSGRAERATGERRTITVR